VDARYDVMSVICRGHYVQVVTATPSGGFVDCGFLRPINFVPPVPPALLFWAFSRYISWSIPVYPYSLASKGLATQRWINLNRRSFCHRRRYSLHITCRIMHFKVERRLLSLFHGAVIMIFDSINLRKNSTHAHFYFPCNLLWTEFSLVRELEFASSNVNGRIGIHVLRTNRALPVLVFVYVPLQPVNMKYSERKCAENYNK